jgi:hypothetical protein
MLSLKERIELLENDLKVKNPRFESGGLQGGLLQRKS